MNKKEVFDLLKTKGKFYCQEKQFIKIFPDIYDDICRIDFPEGFKFSQKLYHYFMDDPNLKLGICPMCGNRCKFININLGYKKHCCQKCSYNDNHTKDKRKQTCIKKYGTEYYSQTDIRKSKLKEKYLKQYGVESYFQTEDFKNKSKVSCLKKYGVNNPFQSNNIKIKIKERIKEKYGVDNPSQADEIKYKKKCTIQEKYGVDNYTQTNEFAKYHRKQIEYDGLTFDSSWEVKVYQYCKENNIPCEYQPDITFEYEYDGKKHYYHPDFLINGKLYEVKGDQFFEGDKMICPYNRNKYLDKMAETKHQCMIKNGIIILRKDDIEKLKERI